MNKFLRWISVTVLALSGLTLIGVFSAREAIAQIRAALVKNVDEPGLVPFSQSFTISTNACGCMNCCFPETPPVPAGKRLVITNVSGYFPVSAAGNLGPVTIQQRDPGPPSTVTSILTVPVTYRTQWNGGDYHAYECNHTVQAYIDAGKKAQLSVYGGVNWDFRPGLLTLNGYLVSLQ